MDFLYSDISLVYKLIIMNNKTLLFIGKNNYQYIIYIYTINQR